MVLAFVIIKSGKNLVYRLIGKFILKLVVVNIVFVALLFIPSQYIDTLVSDNKFLYVLLGLQIIFSIILVIRSKATFFRSWEPWLILLPDVLFWSAISGAVSCVPGEGLDFTCFAGMLMLFAFWPIILVGLWLFLMLALWVYSRKQNRKDLEINNLFKRGQSLENIAVIILILFTLIVGYYFPLVFLLVTGIYICVVYSDNRLNQIVGIFAIKYAIAFVFYVYLQANPLWGNDVLSSYISMLLGVAMSIAAILFFGDLKWPPLLRLILIGDVTYWLAASIAYELTELQISNLFLFFYPILGVVFITCNSRRMKGNYLVDN